MITRKEFLNIVQSLAQAQDANGLKVLEYLEHQNDLKQEQRERFLRKKRLLDDTVYNFFKEHKNKGYVLTDVAYEVTKELKPCISFNYHDIFASVNRINNERHRTFEINRVYNFRQGRVFYYVSDVKENQIEFVEP